MDGILFRCAGITAGILVAMVVLCAAAFAAVVWSRDPLRSVGSTTAAQMSRQACIDCHAPIAAEWRQSLHYRSLTGPFWTDVRQLGYIKVFNATRKACVNCHAPANVLDIAAPGAGGAGARPPGVECTPNLLREPRAAIPAARSDEAELGVDCTSCHVSARGIVGAGRRPPTGHATVPDARFAQPARTSDVVCGTCHGAIVEAWKKTTFAATGVTCLECHMPAVSAASAAAGPNRERRSHRFPADKDPAMLETAVNAELTVTTNRHARFRITNDRVGHYLPSGGNWLVVVLSAYDASGRLLAERQEEFGKEEALLLDVWPFNRDTRIAPRGTEGNPVPAA